MKKFFLMILGVGVFVAAVGYFLGPNSQKENPLKNFTLKPTVVTKSVKIKNQEIKVEIADSDEERRTGLSGREALSEGSGMLFVFGRKTNNPFWMKDVKFPIDIIWIDESKIIGYEKNVPTQLGMSEQELQLYYPPQMVSYVLEVPAGYIDKIGIGVGDSVDLTGI